MRLMFSVTFSLVFSRYAESQIQSCQPGYAVLVPCCTTSKNLSDNRTEVYCPAGCRSKNLSVWGTDIYTENTPICLAAIHAGIGSNGGGYITVQKMPGQVKYTGSVKNGITSLNYTTSPTSYSLLSQVTVINSATIPTTTTVSIVSAITSASTTTPAASTLTRAKSTITIMAPTTASLTTTTTAPTTASLTTTTTAPTTASLTTTTMAPTTASLTTTTMAPTTASLTTTTMAPTTASLTTTKVAPYNIASSTTALAMTVNQKLTTTVYAVNIGLIACGTSLDQLTGDPIRALCPEGCGFNYLWGTDIYTSDSYICVAAIHAGVIQSTGGYVTLKREPSQMIYYGTFQNGIQSFDWDSSGVIESFVFI